MEQTGILRYGVRRYEILHLLAVRYEVSIFVVLFYAAMLRILGFNIYVFPPTTPQNSTTALYTQRRIDRTGMDVGYLLGIYLHRNSGVTTE